MFGLVMFGLVMFGFVMFGFVMFAFVMFGFVMFVCFALSRLVRIPVIDREALALVMTSLILMRALTICCL
jgi:hypothetical protein